MGIARTGLPLIIIETSVMAPLFGLGFSAITDGVSRIVVIIAVEFIVEASVIAVIIAVTCKGTVGFTLAHLRTSLAQQTEQSLHLRRGKFDPATARQSPGQGHRTEPQPGKAADRQPNRFEHAANLAIAALGNNCPVPGICAVATQIIDLTEARRTIIEHDAIEQRQLRLIIDPAKNAHGVFSLPTVARMHQSVGDIARGGEDQQALGIEVEATNRYPARSLQTRQSLKHGGPMLGVISRADLARRLVVQQHPRRHRHGRTTNGPAVDADLIVGADSLTDVGWLTIDRDPPRNDQLFHFTTRTETRIGQQLVQFGQVIIDRLSQHRRAPTGIGSIKP
jgi:hypothetical protein